MKKYYDKTSKTGNEFQPNENVYVWNGRWQESVVKRIWHTPRSYVIQTQSNEYRRNTRDIRKRKTYSPVVNPSHRETQTHIKQTRSGRTY